MALAVASYPKLTRQDYSTIQQFRKENDGLYYSVVSPHFSFVFPINAIGKEPFVREVYDQSKGFGAIDFELKCATVNKDALIEYYHLLLVPDEGYSRIVKLHDRLYGGLFFNHLRLDIDFIPHVGTANSKDPYQVKRWADQWNQQEFSIRGTIDALTVVDYTNNILTDLEHVPLE